MDKGMMVLMIQDAIDDPTVIEVDILAAINRKLKQVASEIRMPGLIEEDHIQFPANSNNTTGPINYEPSHGILYAYSVTNSLELIIRSNTKILFKDRDRTTFGSISEIAPDGETIYSYDGTSAKDKVKLKFYGKPDDLVDDDDEPECIPYSLREPVLVDGTILDMLKFKRYTEEQKIDQARDNEIKKEAAARHGAGMLKLMEFYKEAPKPEPELRRRVRTF